MLSEATQKNHEIDFTTIPILQMEKKPGFRKELTGQAAGKWQNLDLNLGDFSWLYSSVIFTLSTVICVTSDIPLPFPKIK